MAIARTRTLEEEEPLPDISATWVPPELEAPQDTSAAPTPITVSTRPQLPPSEPAPAPTSSPTDDPQPLDGSQPYSPPIQQLPDGTGGSIPVPPPEMAPPTTGTFDPVLPETEPIGWDTTLPFEPTTLPPPGGTTTPPAPTPEPPQEAPAPAAPQPAAPPPPTDPVQTSVPTVESQGDGGWVPPSDTFSMDDNLINSQILPTYDPRAAEHDYAGDLGLAEQDAAPDIAIPGADPRLLRFQQMSDDLLEQMRTQPDRYGMARKYYDDFSAETEGDFDRSLKKATDLGAAHGRLGSGILTNSYGDLAERRLRDKEGAKARFLNEATEGTIRDRQQMWENVSGAEQNAFGEAGANTDELQQEREARRQLIREHYNQADRSLSQGLTDRNEARGERSYQGGLAEQALMRRIMQQLAEGSMDQTQFDQAMRMFGAGNTGDPTGAYNDAAGQSAIEAAAAAGDVALLLRLLAQRQQQNVPATT